MSKKKGQVTEGRLPNKRPLLDTGASTRREAAPDLSKASLRTKIIFVVVLLVLPMALLLGLELLLRFFDVGYPAGLFTPWQQGKTNLWVSNHQFTRRFFPLAFAPQPRAFAMPAQKGTNTTRIFILGESAALGEPEPRFGFGAMLKALLRERFPEHQFEIVNLGIVAINSHVILEIAHESAGHNGDLWIVYMGNNEMVGPFGSLTVMGAQAPSLIVARASLALKKTRTGQVLDMIIQRLRPANSSAAEWHGMASFQKNRVRHDDSKTERVHRNFEQNLDAILKAARAVGVPVLLCTVGTNLKDCPPFASLHRQGMSEPEIARWTTDYEAGKAAEAAGRFLDALANYRKAANIDETYADLQFRMGRCLLSLGQNEEARVSFEKARDSDALQFRADRSINASIRNMARQFPATAVHLVDVEQAISRQSPAGIAGGEFFHEHVHLNPEGNYAVARALAEQVEAALPSLTRASKSEWLSESACFRSLGLNPLNRQEILTQIEKLVSGPPFDPAENAPLLNKLKDQVEKLRGATKINRLRMTIPELRAAVVKHPEDPDLRSNLADVLELVSEFASAEVERQAVTALLPHSGLAYCNLGYTQERLGQPEKALASYQTCVRLLPTYPSGHERLGMLLAKQGRLTDAIPHLQWAVQVRPESVEVRLRLAQALSATGSKAEATEQWKEVLRFDAHNGEALQMLGR